MKTRVYVETSVLSYLAARPSRDPIVEEIHQIRKKMWEECGGDYSKLVARWMAAQKKRKGRLAPKPPRPKRRPVAAK